MEFDFFEAQRGNVEPEVWAGQVRTTRMSLETIPWMLFGWRFGRAGFADSFRDYVDGLVRDVCEKQTCPIGGRSEDWD